MLDAHSHALERDVGAGRQEGEGDGAAVKVRVGDNAFYVWNKAHFLCLGVSM